DYHTAMDLYLQAAEQGYSECQRKVGLVYEGGAGVPKDHTKVVAWYLKAVAQRNGIAQNGMVYCYSKGQGVSRKYIKVTD
ncbi:hypothetical protein F5H01DRAFT_280097, partial [Linnemannia elongata]